MKKTYSVHQTPAMSDERGVFAKGTKWRRVKNEDDQNYLVSRIRA